MVDYNITPFDIPESSAGSTVNDPVLMMKVMPDPQINMSKIFGYYNVHPEPSCIPIMVFGRNCWNNIYHVVIKYDGSRVTITAKNRENNHNIKASRALPSGIKTRPMIINIAPDKFVAHWHELLSKQNFGDQWPGLVITDDATMDDLRFEKRLTPNILAHLILKACALTYPAFVAFIEEASVSS